MQDSRNSDRKIENGRLPPGTAGTGRVENEELVQRAARGDTDAFGELYGIYLGRIYRYVFYQVKDRSSAEDITEDVFVKAWRSIGSCKGKERTFLPWLFRIAHNHIIDISRKRQRELPLEIESIADDSDHGIELEKQLEQQELLNAINSLPANQKQVIVLKFLEGLDNREIGQVLGKNQWAIRIMQMRALAALRNKIRQ
jgi:RNA polymerase sigma-70 factor (ECF subfamily)